MKLQAISSRQFNAALQKASKCISSKAALAILENVLITRRNDGKFFLTSSTGEAQLTIPAPLAIVEGSFDNPVAVPVKFLIPLLATLPDCPVTFDFADNKSLTLEYCTSEGDNVKSGKVSLTYEDGTEFPAFAGMGSNPTRLVLPANVFMSVLGQVPKFVGHEELRPALSCMCIDIDEDRSQMFFVGTNGFVLFKHTYSNDPATGGSDFFRGGEPGQILVHQSYFRTLAVFDGNEEISIESDGHTVRIAAGDIECRCKQVEGKYPNYNCVIPRNSPYHVSFNKREALAVLKRIGMFSDETNRLITLEKEGLFLNFSTEDIDFSRSAKDQVLLTNAECCDQFRIGFKVTNLEDAVQAINADTIRVQLSEPSRPAVLTADEPSPDVLTLAMPMMIND